MAQKGVKHKLNPHTRNTPNVRINLRRVLRKHLSVLEKGLQLPYLIPFY